MCGKCKITWGPYFALASGSVRGRRDKAFPSSEVELSRRVAPTLTLLRTRQRERRDTGLWNSPGFVKAAVTIKKWGAPTPTIFFSYQHMCKLLEFRTIHTATQHTEKNKHVVWLNKKKKKKKQNSPFMHLTILKNWVEVQGSHFCQRIRRKARGKINQANDGVDKVEEKQKTEGWNLDG